MKYAEDLPSWKTNTTSADTWLNRVEDMLESYGATVTSRAVGQQNGRAGLLISFEYEGQPFRVEWPVLQSRDDNRRAALVQAASLLHHHVKAMLVSAEALGARTAFFAHVQLPDGRPAFHLGNDELADSMPKLFN